LNDELHFDYKLRDGICRNKFSYEKNGSDLRKGSEARSGGLKVRSKD
jgi:hypothetical protein